MRTCDFPWFLVNIFKCEENSVINYISAFTLPLPSRCPRHKPVLHFAGLEAEHVGGPMPSFDAIGTGEASHLSYPNVGGAPISAEMEM